MLIIVWHHQFKKDFKKATKHKRKLEKLAYIINELHHSRPLPTKTKIINLQELLGMSHRT